MFKLIGYITKPRNLAGIPGHYYVEKRYGFDDKSSYEQVPWSQTKNGKWKAAY